LPEWMDDKQKKSKVGNLITDLRQDGLIENRGTLKYPEWVLLKKDLA
jgi:ATP-dependent DNA helicase RecG